MLSSNFHRYAFVAAGSLRLEPTTERGRPSPAVAQAALRNLQACSVEIKRWMLTNKLKLNDNKSEALLCGTTRSRSKLQISSV
ncbi:hypothetical protein BaRGS_00028709 [Batillaria attramentaria]|uniref:Uncharacterized protein n=1 Tax=Batillaria attramentaria TaxID=370345 RepID=A0ABD0JYI5_9CAEN